MLRPWHIAVLEVKRFVVDPGRLAFSLALPIVLFALMYGAFSEAGQFNGTAHLVDLDEGPMARELIARLERVDGLQVKLHTSADADQSLDRANILAVAVIPYGFSEGLTAGSPVSITFKQLGSGGAEGQIAASIVQSAALELAGEAQVRAQVRDALKETSLDDAKIDQTVTSLLDQARENPLITGQEPHYRWPVRSAVPAPARHHDNVPPVLGNAWRDYAGRGAAHRDPRAPDDDPAVNVDQLFLGKFLAGASIAALQALILLALAFLVLQVAGVIVFVEAMVFALLIAAAVSAAGLVIGSLARTPDQANWIAVFFTMAMTVFAGTFFDVGDSGPLAVISKFTLNKYSIDGLADIVAGGGLGQQGFEAAVLIGIAVVGLIVARFAFRATPGGLATVSTILRQSLLIAAKDTKIFVRDRFALGFALLFPIVFAIGFSVGLAGVGPSNDKVQFTIVTLEQDGGISHQIIEALTAAPDSSVRTLPYEDAIRAVEAGNLSRLPRLPRQFHQQRDVRPADRA